MLFFLPPCFRGQKAFYIYKLITKGIYQGIASLLSVGLLYLRMPPDKIGYDDADGWRARAAADRWLIDSELMDRG